MKLSKIQMHFIFFLKSLLTVFFKIFNLHKDTNIPSIFLFKKLNYDIIILKKT